MLLRIVILKKVLMQYVYKQLWRISVFITLFAWLATFVFPTVLSLCWRMCKRPMCQSHGTCITISKSNSPISKCFSDFIFIISFLLIDVIWFETIFPPVWPGIFVNHPRFCLQIYCWTLLLCIFEYQYVYSFQSTNLKTSIQLFYTWQCTSFYR